MTFRTRVHRLFNSGRLLLFLLLHLYFCERIICGADDDTTVFRPLQPNELRAYITELLAKNSTQWYNCPAPKLPVTENECKAKRCHNNDDCNNRTCCFNGCVFTCTQQMAPPAVIDWVEESETNSVFSSEALENGTQTTLTGSSEMRPCSTVPRPAPSEPVGCPPGYVCRIENSDDPSGKFLNTGVCVPDIQAGHNSFHDDGLFKERIGKDTVYLPGGCVLTSEQYEHMQKFMLRSYVLACFCIKGSVECKVTL